MARTPDQIIRTEIGELLVRYSVAAAKVEELTEELAKLKAESAKKK